LLSFLDRPASPDPNGKLLALIDHRSHVNSIELLSCVVRSNPRLALMPELINRIALLLAISSGSFRVLMP